MDLFLAFLVLANFCVGFLRAQLFAPKCKEIVCSVHMVDCDAEDKILPKLNDTQRIPDEVHDLRIEPFSKAVSKPGEDTYQLSVDISWQIPPNNSTYQLEAFLLTIEHESSRDCFLFNMSETNWTAQAISHSPRFHFTTDSVFKFGQAYDVFLRSLPGSAEITRQVHKSITMPQHPGHRSNDYSAENCTNFSHPYASKWTAAFRRIAAVPMLKTVQIEFIAAPPHYCFEAYEVRIMYENEMEIHNHSIVYANQLKTETIGNRTVYFGEVVFKSLEPGIYIPSVIPLERAADGRCLCPVHGVDPYDDKVVCSCIAAQGKHVNLTKWNNKDSKNLSTTTSKLEKEPQFSWWPIIFIILMISMLLLIAFLIRTTYIVYHRYRSQGKRLTIRFSHDETGSNTGCARNGLIPNGNAFAQTPLILNPHVNVLIIYTHDGPEHEATVVALAEYLKDVFNLDVHLDRWDIENIERNLMDYISASILSADKVVVLNSIGSSHRYNCKIMNKDYEVARVNAAPLDALFLAQIDQALQHHCVISARFMYSSFNDVLPPLNGHLQYVIPDNLTPFVSALIGRNLKNDPRLVGYNAQHIKLQTTISRMDAKRRAEPDWFDRTHFRRKLETRQSPKKIAEETRQSPKKVPAVKETVLEPLLPTDDSGQYTETVPADRSSQMSDLSQPSTSSGVRDTADFVVEPATPVPKTEPLNMETTSLEMEETPLNMKQTPLNMDTMEMEPSDLEMTPLEKSYICPKEPLSIEKAAKFADSNSDSGVITDFDLRLISA